MATRLRIATGTNTNNRYIAFRNRIRELDRGDLKRKMNREIKKAGEPALAAVRAQTMRINVASTAGGGRRSTGLRRRTAAAMKISTLPQGIRIGVNGKKIDPRYGRSLAFLLNGQGVWKHPVFGTDTEVVQQGEDKFFSTLRPFRDRFRAAVESVLDDISRELE